MTSRQTSASGKDQPGPVFNAGIYLRLTVAAWTAYFAAKHPGENSSLVLGMVLGFMPFTVLFPASWRDQVSYRWCEKWVFWIASALPALAIVAAFADSDLRSPGYPRVALIVAGAAAHSALILLIARPSKGDVMNIWFWSSGAVVATVGVLIDLPNAPGWHALAFFAYGALASGAFRNLVDEPQQDLGKHAAN